MAPASSETLALLHTRKGAKMTGVAQRKGVHCCTPCHRANPLRNVSTRIAHIVTLVAGETLKVMSSNFYPGASTVRVSTVIHSQETLN